MSRPLGFVLIAVALSAPGLMAADGKRAAVLVGIQKYDDAKLGKLEYSERDMTDLAKVLETAGYSVTLFTETTGNKDKTLAPTRENIEKALKSTLGKAGKDDLVLVAFAGHGLAFDGKPGQYLCPRDARPDPGQLQTLISIDTLLESMKSSPAAGKILLVDTGRGSGKNQAAAGIEGEKVKVPAGVLAMFSCSRGERSLEHKDLGHGLFFHEVLAGLKGKAGDGNDAITFASLAEFVSKEVPKDAGKLVEDARQTPFIPPGDAKDSPVMAMHPEAIPLEEWKEYEGVWSKGSTEPFLKKYSAKRYDAWRKSAEAGSARAMMLLADCAEFGVKGMKDAKECIHWYTRSANLGNSFAMVGLAMCYERGFGVAKDSKEAFRWFQKSAELGDAGGMHSLGVSYAQGRGVAKNAKEAVRWYRKSAEKGFAQSMYSLGMAYLSGSGIERDRDEAFAWFRKGADLGNHYCMIYLGFCYRDGVGTAEDPKQAFAWFRKAADTGDSDAMNLVGHCYMEGEGVAKDEKEGANWYRKSAENDNATGMLNIGTCYLSGTGVTKSKVDAVRWLRKAAANGNSVAKELLKELVE